MKKAATHYKFINSKTGYAIYYYSIHAGHDPHEIKEELEKIKAQVAIQNGIYVDTVYYEEFKEEK